MEFGMFRRIKSKEKYVQLCSDFEVRKCFFNDARNTFYLRLYGIGHMV